MLQNLENRALKKSYIGPPDVYAQTDNQKEDLLSPTALKLGFPNDLVCSNEHASAKNEATTSLDSGKIIQYINGITSKKTEYNTISDGGKKKQQSMRDNFSMVTHRHKDSIEKWMTALSNGTKTLTQLGKKVPIFPKKEDILQYLQEYNVPCSRAAWYLKMTAAHYAAPSEARKTTKRQASDPSIEWTGIITKYMYDLIQKMREYYGGGSSISSQAGFLTTGVSPAGIDLIIKQWTYYDRFTMHLYKEGLLDRQEYLAWCIELLENSKTSSSDDNITRILLAFVLQYVEEIVKQYLLARRLAHYCSRKVSIMSASGGYQSPRSTSPHFDTTNNTQSSSSIATAHAQLSEIWHDYTQCSQHRSIVYTLTAMIHSIVLGCPSALIWLNLGEGKSLFIQSGSPLDMLPCNPCLLPMPAGEDNFTIRKQIKDCEIEIARRSMSAELSWSSDKVQQSMTGFITGKLLSILDILDKYDFDKAETSPAISNLYNKIMNIWNEKTNNEPYASLEPLVFVLCEWVITTNRRGAHRAAIVARFLDHHRTVIWGTQEVDKDTSQDQSFTEDNSDDAVFYDILLKFLDTKAPVLDADNTDDVIQQFANLVSLYGEFIRWELFSHNSYVCTLISRGQLGPSAVYTPQEQPASNSFSTNRITSKSVLKEILESDEQSPVDITDQRKPETQTTILPTHRQTRHVQYVTHFPIPQEEQYLDEIYQRSTTLYGFGKGREQSKLQTKKVSKDLLRLFNKKSCIDATNPQTGSWQPRSEKEFDQLLQRFQSLPYYEQYCISSQTVDYVIEMYKNFISEDPQNTHLPYVEHILFLMDLIESSQNINTLIEFCAKIVEIMKKVEDVIKKIEYKTCMDSNNRTRPTLTGKYTEHITVHIVSVLRCHLPSLLLNPKLCLTVFEGIVSGVMELRDAKECSSAQRCILLFLNVLYSASRDIKEDKNWTQFAPVTQKVEHALLVDVKAACGTGEWRTDFWVQQSNEFNIYKFRFDKLFSRTMDDNKTSFVTNTLITLIHADNFNRVNEVAVMCCEYTAYVHTLSSEWLGVLRSLCCTDRDSSNRTRGYEVLCTHVNVAQLSPTQYENISTFFSILLARHCFSLKDFIYIAWESLQQATHVSHDPADKSAVTAGASLTMHILLRVFTTTSSLRHGLLSRSHFIKSTCDIHLLVAANKTIDTQALLAALKVTLLLATSYGSSDEVDEESNDEYTPAGNTCIRRKAEQILTCICAQDWVKERLLHKPEELLKKDMLLQQNYLQPQHSWSLVELICRSRTLTETNSEDIVNYSKQEAVISFILRSLDQWSLRVAFLELQLMYELQNPNHEEGSLSLLLDNIARATRDVFHSCSSNSRNESSDQTVIESQKEGVWLVAPLIAKLPTDVQERVLSSAALVLDNSNSLWQNSSAAKNDKERESSMSLLNHQSFLSLVLTCLKGNDEKREVILSSLNGQLQKFITCAQEDNLPTESYLLQNMYEALQLRLSLIGGMFDTIQRLHNSTSDWAQLLVKLIYYGIVDVNSNSELFYTVLDMLSALIHSMLVSDRADSVENSKRPYHSLLKKIKKELGGRDSDSIQLVRQLLTLPRYQIEVIACETHGSLLDTRGNKIVGFESVSKKSGLQVTNKHSASPWELLEGQKSIAPLSWHWFNAVKMDKKLLSLEEQTRLMRVHNHNTNTDLDLLAPPTLPKEEEVDLTEPSEPEVKMEVEEPPQKKTVTKTPAAKREKRKPSVKNTNKNSPYNPPSAPRGYEPRSLPQHTQSGWTSRPPIPQYHQQSYYSAQPGTVGPRIPGMVSRSAVKESVKDLIIHKQRGTGSVGSGMMMGPGSGFSTPMDITGSTSSNEAMTNNTLRNHVMTRQRQKGPAVPEIDPNVQPPPQYPTGGSYRGMPGGYNPMSQSHGYAPQPGQGGMMMSGNQGPNPSMMSYGGSAQSSLPSYQQAGQQGYNPPYQQQYPDNRGMIGPTSNQYLQRNNMPHSGAPNQSQYSSNHYNNF